MFKTQAEFRKIIEEAGTWLAAACIGGAVVASLTVVLIPLGMWLVLAAGGAFLLSMTLSRVVPAFWRYHTVTCPYCREVNMVRFGIGIFPCGGCTTSVRIKVNNKRTIVTLLVPHKKIS